MNILITGDRNEASPSNFNARLQQGLAQIGEDLMTIKNIVRTSYGGAELRAHELAEDIGIGVIKLPLPPKMGKHARAAAINEAVELADKIIILDDPHCLHVDHIKKMAFHSGKPLAVV
jgi:hypothetical protein